MHMMVGDVKVLNWPLGTAGGEIPVHTYIIRRELCTSFGDSRVPILLIINGDCRGKAAWVYS